MEAEIDELEADASYRNGGEEDGQKVYRDCYTGCASMGEYLFFRDHGDPGAKARLRQACRECHLKAAPSPQASLVWRHGWVRGSRLAGDAPYWLVRAVERMEARRRVF